MNKKFVLPVVHHLTAALSIEQGALALMAGADGVFLISHGGADSELWVPAKILKDRFPEKKIGINLLGSSAMNALEEVVSTNLDMVWTDTPGVRSDQITNEAEQISQYLLARPKAPQFFGSVAFKYQMTDSNPPEAACRALRLGMIPTTSGSGTGSAPDVSKIEKMCLALTTNSANREHSLAVASGMTPENVLSFLPYVSHFLVATGISSDMHHFDETKMKKFIEIVKNFED